MINASGKRILISRTDSIGDVILTLPIAAKLKEHFPDSTIAFLCKKYTEKIVLSYTAIDEVYCWDEVEEKTIYDQSEFLKGIKADIIIHVFPKSKIAKAAKKAEIAVRIGTSHRLFHLWTCNYKVDFTRKKSDLHESQLNFKLLKPFGLEQEIEFDQVNNLTRYFQPKEVNLPDEITDFLKGGNYFILHAKSQGSALEWPMYRFSKLATLLALEKKKVVFTGTEKEGELIRNQIPENEFILDTTGKLSIEQLLDLIKNSKGLVACSTGPLHLAGMLNVKAIGLFSSRRPIHPGRWKPLGVNSTALTFDENCKACSAGEECNCLSQITAERVITHLL